MGRATPLSFRHKCEKLTFDIPTDGDTPMQNPHQSGRYRLDKTLRILIMLVHILISIVEQQRDLQ